MEKMKKLVGFCFVVALYLGAHGTEASVSFSLLGATSASYKQFINNLRTTLTAGTPIVYNIPVLRSTAAGAARYLLVQLTNYNRESITVALDVVNVYVVAYQAGNTRYFLNDAPAGATGVLFTSSTRTVTLSYGGNYDGLERAAGSSRENIDLGFSVMSSSIGSMFHYDVGTAVPRAFIVIIQMVSEAARFKYIEQRVSESVQTTFRPDPAFLSLQNNWGSLSEQIQIAQFQGGKFSRPIELRTVSNAPIIVDNVNSPVVRGIALLKYYRVTVAIDNITAMLSAY